MQTSVALQEPRLPAVEGRATRAVVMALLGAAAIGACLGIRGGAGAMALRMFAMPSLFVGMVILTGPALFVGLAVAGEAPPFDRFLRHSAASVGDIGVLLLGLTPATLFLMASVRMVVSAGFIGFIVLGFAYLVGIRSLLHRLSVDGLTLLGITILVGWSLLAARIGVHALEKLILY